MAYDLSIACVYNKLEQFERFRHSVEDLPFRVQLIAMDNRERAWSSAAAAYNHAVDVAESDVVLFSHQDIVFLDGSFISEFIEKVRENHDLLVGVAGAVETEGGYCRKMVSGMYQGSKLWRHHTAESPTMVSTLDECLFGCHKDLFSKVHFDEETCNGWHFYAVDLSLQVQDADASVMVLPASVLHLSGGNRDDSYYVAQEKLKKKYAKSREVIVTTCGWTRTGFIDPYRPIVDDELAALDRAGISYSVRFFRSWNEVGNLCNKVFLPSLFPSDGFSDVTLSEEGSRLYSGIAMVRNFISSKRWLYEDLRDLKRDYVVAVEEECRGTREYRLGTKFLPWIKVQPHDTVMLETGSSNGGVSASVAPMFSNDGAVFHCSVDDLEFAFSKGEGYFSSYILSTLQAAEANLPGLPESDSKVFEPLLRSSLLSCGDACKSLCALVRADEFAEIQAERVRRLYASCLPSRVGRLLLRVGRKLFR